MKKRVLVVGGYGNFGKFITRCLVEEDNLNVSVLGRSLVKASNLADVIMSEQNKKIECYTGDIFQNPESILSEISPDILIHTSGPFQNQNYAIVEACIKLRIHYIDLSDSRRFVEHISTLNNDAIDSDVLVVSGASSVPGLTSAILDFYQDQFKILDEVEYGITTAQKTTKGVATTSAILSYVGRPFFTLVSGKFKKVFGWQDISIRKLDGIGIRLFGNCDVPDLTLFPERYPELQTIRFKAGIEVPLVHVVLWLLSFLVRFRLLNNLAQWARAMIKMAGLFDFLGSDSSAFYMTMKGQGENNGCKTLHFELIAHEGDGLFIPCIPSILLTKHIANGTLQLRGSHPCLGLVPLHEYLCALEPMKIRWRTF